MLIMGISGGPFRSHEDGGGLTRFMFHDSAAVLLDNCDVVAAIETERLNRIKHSNKFPAEAIRFCLEKHGVSLQDLHYFAYYGEEEALNTAVAQWHVQETLDTEDFESGYTTARGLLQGLLASEFNYEIPTERLVFVNHHYAHALSAFLPSGFDESLIATLDAQGDNESGRILLGRKSSVETLVSFPVQLSLGGLYVEIIKTLGFQQFDEYKAMGLAPYGDPARFADLFKTFYALLPNGSYSLNWGEIGKFQIKMKTRRRKDPFTQDHMDVAAALQGILGEIVFHTLKHYQQKTQQRNLCLAGGVAHNCALNGEILASKIFERVFVQPAAHDAGCAYGAALSVHLNNSQAKITPLRHVYWGSDIGGDGTVANALSLWQGFIIAREFDDICSEAARLIADGSVMGWVQGRSEFGPRALGNRSILADPRPEENKAIINSMVKKREAFRPFAPAVLEEYAQEFFEVEERRADLSYMVFAVKVKPEKRPILGAVTHIDGSARVQTVSRSINGRFWNLINEFKEITGIPVLLNTSFNNNAEPIVNSIEDAIACFLTTKLDYLVIADHLICKRKAEVASYLKLIPSLPKYTIIFQARRVDQKGLPTVFFGCRNNFNLSWTHRLSAAVCQMLLCVDGRLSLAELIACCPDARNEKVENLIEEIRDLWARRLITLKTAKAGTASLVRSAG